MHPKNILILQKLQPNRLIGILCRLMYIMSTLPVFNLPQQSCRHDIQEMVLVQQGKFVPAEGYCTYNHSCKELQTGCTY